MVSQRHVQVETVLNGSLNFSVQEAVQYSNKEALKCVEEVAGV